jgi:hypothetical protein
MTAIDEFYGKLSTYERMEVPTIFKYLAFSRFYRREG